MIPITEDTNIFAVDKFADKIKDIYYEYFPNSMCNVTLNNSADMLTIYTTLSNRQEAPQVNLNDAFWAYTYIYNSPHLRDLDLDGNLEMLFDVNTILVDETSREGEPLAFDSSRKICRVVPDGTEIQGSADDILDEWGKFVRKLYKKVSRLYSQGAFPKQTLDALDFDSKL